uniref:Uncharacterized protein n=1 Tax=Nelumbo nucifera TaxID=4432 RepID=A0A822ZYT6_NELNU|nr:TPA_asm: hypothetical protein HUJ06_017933 [Nelumbo nucifera]
MQSWKLLQTGGQRAEMQHRPSMHNMEHRTHSHTPLIQITRDHPAATSMVGLAETAGTGAPLAALKLSCTLALYTLYGGSYRDVAGDEQDSAIATRRRTTQCGKAIQATSWGIV